MKSRTIVERRVPVRDRTRNKRVLSTENAALRESNKKVPQTPRRQPATNPDVKPPITSPFEKIYVLVTDLSIHKRAMKPKTGNQEP